jgi:hypothetical protein
VNLTESAKNFGFRNFKLPESLTNYGNIRNIYKIVGLQDVSVLTQEEIFTRMFTAFGKVKQELDQVHKVNTLIREEIDLKDLELGTFQGRETEFLNANLDKFEAKRRERMD